MTAFDRDLIRDAVRLFEARAISAAEAEDLHDQLPSREDFLGELWLRRTSLERFPELAAAIKRIRTSGLFAGGRTERAFYEALCARLDPFEPTALYVPRWRGVTNSTRSLFRQTIPIPATASHHPDDIDPVQIAAYADLLLASRVRHFIVSGGDHFHLQLIDSVLQRDSDIRFDLLWHSNYLQMGEKRDWELLRLWLHAAEYGAITRIGVVKSNLDRFFRQAGIASVFIPNFVPLKLDPAKSRNATDVIGIWLSGSSSYRKLPHAMIAAVKAMRTFYLKGAGLGREGLALISALDVPFLQVFEDVMPYERLLREMSNTAITLYVTVSESSPMLPLESFSVGVPCLIGPNSHLFRDHELLRKMLVVEEPYNPALIADMAVAAAARTDELQVVYGRYNEEIETQTREALTRFLA